jgi:hypothetical protein
VRRFEGSKILVDHTVAKSVASATATRRRVEVTAIGRYTERSSKASTAAAAISQEVSSSGKRPGQSRPFDALVIA